MSAEQRAPRAVVVGGTGSVGRHVCAALADAGHDVLVIARTPSPATAAHRFVAMDVAASDPADIAAVLADSEASVVVNAAGKWSNDAAELDYAHIRLVERLIAGMAAVPARPRLVHVGTVHEYGAQPVGTSVAETTIPLPTTDYARVKFASSRLVLDAAGRGEIDAVVLRVSNVYGPDPARGSFLGFLVEKLADLDPAIGLELTIADAQRDYLDNRDLATAVRLAASRPLSAPVLNIGSGTAVSMRELVYALVAAAGLPPSAVREKTAALRDKGGEWTKVDAGLAAATLGWHAKYTLADSVRAMVSARETV
ncbi:NAD-dependent epimerase/dehydratase family protein [Actinophytocola sediminis]